MGLSPMERQYGTSPDMTPMECQGAVMEYMRRQGELIEPRKSQYKAWVLSRASTHNREHGTYECEHVGTLEQCIEYLKDIAPRFGWVISDDRNRFVCGGDIPASWLDTRLA